MLNFSTWSKHPKGESKVEKRNWQSCVKLIREHRPQFVQIRFLFFTSLGRPQQPPPSPPPPLKCENLIIIHHSNKFPIASPGTSPTAPIFTVLASSRISGQPTRANHMAGGAQRRAGGTRDVVGGAQRQVGSTWDGQAALDNRQPEDWASNDLGGQGWTL
jgi:hypothetical protein